MIATGMERFADWIFDLDGTLADSAPDILLLLAAVLRENNLDVPELDNSRIGPLLEDIVRGICPQSGPAELEHIVQVYRARYRVCPFNHSPLFMGIPALFSLLAERGCRLFVATNKPEDVSRRLLSVRGLLPCLSGIACSDSIPGQQISKTQMLSVLMERHRIAPESAIMVGDSVFDMHAGRATGMATGAALYGYGQRDALLQTEPDYCIEDAAWTRVFHHAHGSRIMIL